MLDLVVLCESSGLTGFQPNSTGSSKKMEILNFLVYEVFLVTFFEDYDIFIALKHEEEEKPKCLYQL